MNDMLSKLFGSSARVKIVRLFLLNPEEIVPPREIVKRAKVTPQNVKKEISMLSSIGFIKKKKQIIYLETKTGKKKKRVLDGWALDSEFSLLLPLKKLVLNTAPIARRELLSKINKIGVIKFVALAGIFIQEDNSRADVLIVGDKLKKPVLKRVLKEIEAAVGKELDYAVFTTDDFFYRLNIYDKFIRDILDYPHEKMVNKLGI